jgi:cysteine desulfurase
MIQPSVSDRPVIYLDHNATTPLDSDVRAYMEDVGYRVFGNPSSIHYAGQEARRTIDKARADVARLIGAGTDEIIFTSGGTEANNLAILGAIATRVGDRGNHIITSAIEHQSARNPCLHLQKQGVNISFVSVDPDGVIDPEDAISEVRDETALISIMLANNDVGSIQPVAAVAAGVSEQGVILHTDAVQAAGKIPVNVKKLGVDLLSLSSHKIYGPKGIGALYVRRGIKIAPLFHGGHQERELRPGTENVAAIAGFGLACRLAADRLDQEGRRISELRSSMESSILSSIQGSFLNGGKAERIPNTSNIGFNGIDGEMLAINLDILGVAVSTGSACSSTETEPSHVLTAMGQSPLQAHSSIRISLGRNNTAGEIDRAVWLLQQAVESIRNSATC